MPYMRESANIITIQERGEVYCGSYAAAIGREADGEKVASEVVGDYHQAEVLSTVYQLQWSPGGDFERGYEEEHV